MTYSFFVYLFQLIFLDSVVRRFKRFDFPATLDPRLLLSGYQFCHFRIPQRLVYLSAKSLYRKQRSIKVKVPSL